MGMPYGHIPNNHIMISLDCRDPFAVAGLGLQRLWQGTRFSTLLAGSDCLVGSAGWLPGWLVGCLTSPQDKV